MNEGPEEREKKRMTAQKRLTGSGRGYLDEITPASTLRPFGCVLGGEGEKRRGDIGEGVAGIFTCRGWGGIK